MELPYNLSEIHFVALPSQSNIYGLAVLNMVGGAAKLLVASLRRPIVCVEYVNNKPFEPLNPSSKEIQFTYIPGGAEIISIDSFNRSLSSNDFIIGITFSKDKAGEPPHVHQYFNIYTDLEPISEFRLEAIAQSCNSLELDFVPYKLFHTELWKGAVREITWLLSGSDHNVHLYREDKTHAYIEYPIGEYFSEFVSLPSIILSADVAYFDEHQKRLTAMGCEDGYIRVVYLDVPTNTSISSWEIKHDSPITSVKLFTLTNIIEPPSFLPTGIGESSDSQEETSDPGTGDNPEFHLLVASATEAGVVYWNVLLEGLKDQKMLMNSDALDCVQCTCIADINMDGTNEIVLGTYGQQLLVYKYNRIQSTRYQNLSPLESKLNRPNYRSQQGDFVMMWQRSFAYPLLAIEYLDVTGDGMKELVVLTTKGLHILQHNLEEVGNLLTDRLDQLVRNLNKNDAFKELQAEDIAM